MREIWVGSGRVKNLRPKLPFIRDPTRPKSPIFLVPPELFRSVLLHDYLVKREQGSFRETQSTSSSKNLLDSPAAGDSIRAM